MSTLRHQSTLAVLFVCMLGVASVVVSQIQAAPSAGSLIKASSPAVYYLASDGKRYVFPNEKTYTTWYDDFSNVQQIGDSELANIPIGGNVTYKPATRLVKITSIPKVYAVDHGGVLRWIETEDVAQALFGEQWSWMVQDITDAFFTNYTIGDPVSSHSDYDPGTVASSVIDIDTDRRIAAGLIASPSTIPVSDVVVNDNATPPATETSSTTETTTESTEDAVAEESEVEIPACSGQQFTVSPVEPASIDSITPMGNLNPPGHTFPTGHTYWHGVLENGYTKVVDLLAPGTMVITNIVANQANDDFGIFFSLCEDVHGYFGHAKELAPALWAAMDGVPCNTGWADDSCARDIRYRVDAGILLGKAGGGQHGTFDFGVYDERVTLSFANMERYGSGRGIHMVCPLDYYPSTLRSTLAAKFPAAVNGKCGEPSQDVAGTLQGNWYHESNPIGQPFDWEKQLAFVHAARRPEEAIVSIGGTFTDAGTWGFTEVDEGQINRRFTDVTADGNMYCYDSQYHPFEKILVQMTSATELRIEHQRDYQQRDCTGEEVFQNPYRYLR